MWDALEKLLVGIRVDQAHHDPGFHIMEIIEIFFVKRVGRQAALKQSENIGADRFC